jgi:uncharacterized protein (TIGR02284 family)
MIDLTNETKPSVLNLLLQTCVDGEEGYQLASDSVKARELKEILARYSAQRTRFRQELKIFLKALAEPFEEEPTITGAVHHGWINLKAIASDGNAHAILVECVRGESVAVERYGKAIKEGEIPEDADAVVRRQRMEISDACSRMEYLARRAK